MLQINDVSELREKVAHKEEIRESIIGDGLTTFCYMISEPNTFDDDWGRECRGIVFDQKGKVCARPLHKFFNVNERESTQVGNIDWSRVVRVMEKRDGSMIHTVINRYASTPAYSGLTPHSGLVRVKSKKSFDSDVAKAAWMWILRYRNYFDAIQYSQQMNVTLIFEYTAPDARIVLQYNEPELRLLHIRDNDEGLYWELHGIRDFARKFDLKIVDEVKEFWRELTLDEQVDWFNGQTSPTHLFDVDRLLNVAKNREGVEGWVIQFSNGEMVKMKTEWYMQRHRAMTFLRERDIAEMVLVEQLDDLKALLVGDGVDIAEILTIEKRVVDDIRELERKVKVIAAPEDFPVTPSRAHQKAFVEKYRLIAGEHFGLLMDLYAGKQPDYKYYFEKNMFKQNYTLRQLVLIPSVAEAE